MKILSSLLFGSALAFSSAAALSASAAELIQNGGFENGVYSDTQGGNTNSSVPVGWTPNAAFDLNPGFNNVGTAPNSGTYNLSIANYDYQPIAALSQTFADVAGSTYAGSLYVYASRGGDAAANFTASIDGATEVSVGDTINSYTQETFSFVGTGHDTLQIVANTNPGEWEVDDVSISGAAAAVSAAPEPSTWLLMIAGIGGIGLMLRRAKQISGFKFKDAFAA